MLGDVYKRQSQEAAAIEEQKKLDQQSSVAQDVFNRSQGDSYSVFGSFDNSTGAQGSQAKVGLGKIFATGVASQNISSGLEHHYKNQGAQVCYDAVSTQAASLDVDTLRKLLAACHASAEAEKNPGN